MLNISLFTIGMELEGGLRPWHSISLGLMATTILVTFTLLWISTVVVRQSVAYCLLLRAVFSWPV